MSIRNGKNYRYGIHVPDKKSLSSEQAIEVMPAPAKLYIGLSQHIGAPALPIVAVGDKVKKGQMIGEASGAISANVYSSVSGTVVGIEDIVNGLGQKIKYIVIENDFKNDELLFEDLTDFEAKTLIERIKLAGIVGLGGAGFPTAVKLMPKDPLDILVINGAECEPYLNCDYRLMLERTEDIYRGIIYLKKALNIEKVVVGIEKNKPQAIEAFRRFEDLDVVVLKKQYPMGSEKHLIYCTTGKKVPTGKMPFDVGVCVQNIKTVIACYEAIEKNKPLTEIVLTVSGEGIKNPKNLKVALGTPFTDIIEYCGGETGETAKVIAGGPMMGRAMISLNSFARKTDSGIILLRAEDTSLASPTNCISCGVCAKNCPMRLMPMYIEQSFLAGDYKSAEKYGAMNCLECGSCAFNCPAKRPLVQNIAHSKQKIKEMKQNG